MNIINLPESILEEIFSYVDARDVKQLCLVSKYLKDIIRKSQKLMSVFKLDFATVKDNIDFDTIIDSMFIDDGRKDLNTNYKYKSRIKSIQYQDKIKHLDNFLAFIISFENLEKVILDNYHHINDPFKNMPDDYGQIALSKLEKLKYLKIDADNPNKILNMFSLVPNIEVMCLFCWSQPIVFPKNAVWKLRTLAIQPSNIIQLENNLEFFGKQSSTLKNFEFSLDLDTALLNFTLRNLTNLELLIIDFSENYHHALDTNSLITNSTLKFLIFEIMHGEFSHDNIKVQKDLIQHYKYIERLVITNRVHNHDPTLNDVSLPNLKHLVVASSKNPLLKYAQMDNLKKLTFLGCAKSYDLLDCKVLSQIESLTIGNCYIFCHDILQHFPSLCHLKLGLGFKLHTSLNEILKYTPQIKSIHFYNDVKGIREARDQVINKDLKILCGDKESDSPFTWHFYYEESYPCARKYRHNFSNEFNFIKF